MAFLKVKKKEVFVLWHKGKKNHRVGIDAQVYVNEAQEKVKNSKIYGIFGEFLGNFLAISRTGLAIVHRELAVKRRNLIYSHLNGFKFILALRQTAAPGCALYNFWLWFAKNKPHHHHSMFKRI